MPHPWRPTLPARSIMQHPVSDQRGLPLDGRHRCRFSKCGASVDVSTSTVTYQQDFLVSMQQTCGDPKISTWTAELRLTGAVTSSSTNVNVNYTR